MSYRLEKTANGEDLVIEGFETGIAPSPHKGIANIQNGNISTETGEVTASFSRAKQSQTPITGGTLTTTGSSSTTYTSSSTLQAGQWINVTAVSGVTYVPTSTTIPTIRAYAAGGGGAGYFTNNTVGGGGGGGGAFSQNTNYTVAVGSYTVVVGTHGNAGGNNTPGTDGSDSSFGSFAILLAKGGKGGLVANTHGAGGLASGGVGDVKYNGGDGGDGGGTTSGGGGGGGGAGSTGAGAAGSGRNHGAGTTVGGGDGGDGDTASIPGGTGQAYGGGGGGGSFYFGSQVGGPGADGAVVITYPTGRMTATGGTITTGGGNTIHTFTSSGTFTISALGSIALPTGSYFVDYYDGVNIKLSFFYDPTGASPISYTHAGTLTFSTSPNMGAPVAQAIEKYNDSSGVWYRYYVLDSAGLVWVYDSGLYASTLLSHGVGVTWFLPDTSVSYWGGTTPSGIGVLNGWLLSFAGNTVHCKETVNLGNTTANTTTYRTMRFTTPASTDDAYLMSQNTTTNPHYVLVGHQGKAYYTDGNFLGSIFPDVTILSDSTNTIGANVQSYSTYTSTGTDGTLSIVIGGSVPFIDNNTRYPVVFFPSAGGSIAAALTADTVFWIGDFSGETNAFRVYAASTGGSALDITSGAVGTQYFNSFFPVGDDASAGADHATCVFTNQRVNLPFSEISQYLVEIGNSVLIGCASNIVYPWNQVDALPSGLISLPERDVKAMITVNQMAYIFAGNNGNIYITDGSTASLVLNIPDYCAGVPGSPGTYIEPNYYWGGAMYLRGRVYFSVRDQVSGKAGNCGGIWSFVPTQNLYIGQDTGIALRLESQNSYATYNGVNPLLIPNQVQDQPVPLYWSPWTSDLSTPTYGIDYSNSGTLATSVTIIETDLIPIGTFLLKKTYRNLEYKLASALDAGATVTAEYRVNGTDAWAACNTFSVETSALSGIAEVNFDQDQWLQLRFTLTPITSSANSNSFIRFRQIRIR